MLDFIIRRHSIRKFKDENIPDKDLIEIIKAAALAPSGKNSQNWHFIVIKNRNKLNEIADIVKNKELKLSQYIKDGIEKNKFISSIDNHIFFKDAPITVFVYAGPYPDNRKKILKNAKVAKEEIEEYINVEPRIQNIGAAMENLLLAAANLGYGGCWMTGPMLAKKEIEKYIGFYKDGYRLVCMAPLGVPSENEIISSTRKPTEEILTIID